MADRTESLINNIISGINPSWNKDEVIRYVYIALGKLISKNVCFFYSLGEKLEENNLTFEEIKEAYNTSDNSPMGIVCKTCTTLLKRIFDKIGIDSFAVQTSDYNRHKGDEEEFLDIYHWFLCVTGENDKKMFLTLIPDLSNIQFGMKTKHFANNIYYKRENKNGEFVQIYKGDEIKNTSLSDEEIELLDRKIGYVTAYEEVQKDKTVKLKCDYNDVFLDYLKEIIVRKDEYSKIIAEDTTFYKAIKSYRIDGLPIDDYLSYTKNVDMNKVENWFEYILFLAKKKFQEDSIEMKDIKGKIDGLRKCIIQKKGSKYRLITHLMAVNFVNKKYLIGEDGTCSNDYVLHKFEKLFPLLFCCNEEKLKPLTAEFNGLSEQLDFIDIFMDNMFAELKELKVNSMVDIDPSLSLIRNRINRYIIMDKETGEFLIVFYITGKENYFLFNPNTGKFGKILNVFELMNDKYTYVSTKLKDRMKVVENIEEVEPKL